MKLSRNQTLALAAVGGIAAFTVSGLMLYAGMTHQGVFDVVRGVGDAPAAPGVSLSPTSDDSPVLGTPFTLTSPSVANAVSSASLPGGITVTLVSIDGSGAARTAKVSVQQPGSGGKTRTDAVTLGPDGSTDLGQVNLRVYAMSAYSVRLIVDQTGP